MYRSSAYPPLAYLAPGAPAVHHLDMPGQEHALPRVDEHAVQPETREELVGGQVIQALPSDTPHGDRHFQLDYVLGAHLAPGYEGSTDLLTRTSEDWNFATDASIRKKGEDPATGERYLEELAFEIKHTQRLGELEARARELIKRGVRRVFAICVKKDSGGKTRVGPVLEWSGGKEGWREFGVEDFIEDPCLVHPLPVKVLLAAAEADDAIVEALAAKGNRALREREQKSYNAGYQRGADEGYQRGEEHALRQGIRDLCMAFDIELTLERDARIEAMDKHELDNLRAALKAHRAWPG